MCKIIKTAGVNRTEQNRTARLHATRHGILFWEKTRWLRLFITRDENSSCSTRKANSTDRFWLFSVLHIVCVCTHELIFSRSPLSLSSNVCEQRVRRSRTSFLQTDGWKLSQSVSPLSVVCRSNTSFVFLCHSDSIWLSLQSNTHWKRAIYLSLVLLFSLSLSFAVFAVFSSSPIQRDFTRNIHFFYSLCLIKLCVNCVRFRRTSLSLAMLFEKGRWRLSCVYTYIFIRVFTPFLSFDVAVI